MSHHPVLVDLSIAVVIAVVVLVLSGGVAMGGVIALLVLVVLAASFGVSRWQRRRAGRRPAVSRARRRPGA